MILKKKIWYLLLFLFVLDIAYSFIQHYLMPLDGDLASITLPSKGYSTVMSDPFGIRVLVHGEIYPAPNRYFAHLFVSGYFKTMPFLLQTIVSPIKSLYISCAIAKTAIQVLLTIILSCYICCWNLKKETILVCCLLISPLFQTGHDNYKAMGIIDESIVYTFFYALPISLLLLFIFPFYKAFILNENLSLSLTKKFSLFILAILLSFNGALLPGIVLLGFSIILSVYFFHTYRQNYSIKLSLQKMNKTILLFFLFFMALSIYSLFIGRNNLENFNNELGLSIRFQRVFAGLQDIFIIHKGLSGLVVIIVFNFLLIYFNKIALNQSKLKELFLPLLLFSILYVLLLPFGGFRDYRPNILRNDTMIPVVLIFFYMFGSSTFLILTEKKMKMKFYLPLITLILLLYTYLDFPPEVGNWSERLALKKISESSLHAVPITDSCTVLSWGLINDSLDTEINSQMLKYWGVTKTEKLYYHQLGVK